MFLLDKKYYIKEITIKEFYEIQNKLMENNVHSKLEIISEFSNCPLYILRNLGREEFLDIWIDFLKNNLNLAETSTFYKTFSFNNITYEFIDLNKLTIGEFIDMDIINRDPQRYTKLHDMLAILYRPIDSEYDVEDAKKRADIFIDLPIKYSGKSIHYYFNYANMIMHNYKGLFDGELEDEDNLEPKHIRNIRNWYSTLISINEDPTRLEEVTKLSVNNFFNFLAYRKDKVILEEEYLKNKNRNGNIN